MTAPHLSPLLEKFAAERAALLAAARSLNELSAEARRLEATGEDGWSPKEQLAHIGIAEVIYRRVTERALSESNPEVSEEWKPHRHDSMVKFPHDRAHEATVAELISQAVEQRAATLVLLERLTEADLQRVATTSFFGTLTVAQWVRSLYRHDRMHAAQIAGREPDYQPRMINRRS